MVHTTRYKQATQGTQVRRGTQTQGHARRRRETQEMHASNNTRYAGLPLPFPFLVSPVHSSCMNLSSHLTSPYLTSPLLSKHHTHNTQHSLISLITFINLHDLTLVCSSLLSSSHSIESPVIPSPLGNSFSSSLRP